MKLTREEIQEYLLHPEDILVNRVNSRELVGKAAWIPSNIETCVYESKNIRLRLKKSYADSKFINFWFQFFSQRYFDRNSQQTVGMASINQIQLGSMPIPLPSLVEQQEIVRRIESLFKLLKTIEQNVDKVRIKTNQMYISILDRAYQGKLLACFT
jgi:type I restriction enzyme S subunit